MKKNIFIGIGILFVLSIIGVWVYLFVYGTPKSASDIFARFGGNAEENIVPEAVLEVSNETSDENPKAKKLRQLTLKPTIGATFVDNAIRYVEAGTGHVYSIDLSTNNETLLTGTTIQKAREAIFSKDGSQVAITTLGDVFEQTTLVGTIEPEHDSGNLKGFSLPDGAKEIHFGIATNTLEYVIEGQDRTTGYVYNNVKKTSVELFTVPLRDIHVLWGNPIYIYTTPTATQEGYIYSVNKNTLEYVTSGGNSLTGILYDLGIIVSRLQDTVIVSTAYGKDGSEVVLPIPLIHEKCVFKNIGRSLLYCASPSSLAAQTFPDAWYKGTVSYSDILWSIDPQAGTAQLLADILKESSREVDVAKIGISQDGTKLWFINKNDNTLWMYDMSVEE